jgi:hypothetical protein
LKSEVTKQEKSIAPQREYFEAMINQLRKKMETVVARAKEQDVKIQDVSDRTHLTKPSRTCRAAIGTANRSDAYGRQRRQTCWSSRSRVR